MIESVAGSPKIFAIPGHEFRADRGKISRGDQEAKKNIYVHCLIFSKVFDLKIPVHREFFQKSIEIFPETTIIICSNT